jgi:hypothetical protein
VRSAVSVPCFGNGVDAAPIADWAVAAELAGWDAFLWDHLFGFAPGLVDVVDPWIALARLDGRWEVTDTAAVASRIAKCGVQRRRRSTWRCRARPTVAIGPGWSATARISRRARPGGWRRCTLRYGWAEGGPWPLAAMLERIQAGP